MNNEADLLRRLELLERRRRNSRGLLLASFFLVITALGVINAQDGPFQPPPEDPNTPRPLDGFQLKDPQGRVRAMLDFDKSGSPGLDFFDKKGQVRLRIGTTDKGEPSIWLFGEDGASRAGLCMTPDDAAALSLHDGKGKPKLQAVAQREDRALIQLSDSQDVVTAYLEGSDKAAPMLFLIGKDRLGGLQIGRGETERSVIKFWDSHHGERLVLGLDSKEGKDRSFIAFINEMQRLIRQIPNDQ